MAEPTLSVDYMDLVRVVARQMGYGSTYSTGTAVAYQSDHSAVSSKQNTIELTGGVWPDWAGNAAINIGGTVYGIASRGSDTVLTADPITLPASLQSTSDATVSNATAYVLVQSITDDKADTFRDIQDVIDQGYQELCFPAASQDMFFIWSWLLERAAISFADDVPNYDLPDNFGQFIDTAITYKEGLDLPAVTMLSQKEYRGEQSRDNAAGVPQYLMWRQKPFTSSTGRRFEALLYPTPSSDAFPDPEYTTGRLTSHNGLSATHTLGAEATSTDGTFTVASSTWVKDTLMLIDDEIVTTTNAGTSATSMNVTRGSKGTTAAAHANSSKIYKIESGPDIRLTGGTLPNAPAQLIVPGTAGTAGTVTTINSKADGTQSMVLATSLLLQGVTNFTIRHNVNTFSRDKDFVFDGQQLEYMYRVVPEALNPTNRYPLCGSIHGDTLMKACQAVAERKLGDDAGIYEAKFKERLGASIAVDRAVKETMGI